MGSSIDRFLSRSGEKPEEARKHRRGLIGLEPDEDSVTQRLNVVRTATDPGASDRATRILRLQQKTGLPSDLVDRNLDQVELEARRSDFDPIKFSRESPIVAKWLAEQPGHLAAAAPDLTRLSYLERQVRHISSQNRAGGITTELSRIGERALLGKGTRADVAREVDLEQELAEQPDYGITGNFEGVPGAIANQIPILAKTVVGKVKGAAVGGAGGALVGAGAGAAVGALGGPGGALAGAATGARAGASRGALLGWRYGAAVEAGRLEAGLAYLEFRKMKDENGVTLDRDTAVGAALIVGVVNGALEGLIGIETLKTVPGLRTLGRSGLKRALLQQTTRQAFLRYAKSIGSNMAAEGITEAMQSLVKNAAGEFGIMQQDGSLERLSTGAILDRVFSDEHLAEAKAEVIPAMQAGGGITAITGAASLAVDVRRAKQAKQNAAFFRALGQVTTDSKLKEQLPEKLEEVVDRLTRDGPVERVYAPIDVFNEYWQSKSVDPGEVAEEILGDRVAYEEANRTGGLLPIPTSRYAATLASSEHSEFFAKELRLTPDAVSEREGQELEKRLDEEEAGAQKEAEAAAPEEAAAATVESTVAEQLTAAGVEPGAAKTQAQLYGSTFRAMGKRVGADPLELFQRYGVQVSREEGETPAPIDVRKVDLAEMARRAVDIRQRKAATPAPAAEPTEEEIERTAIQGEGAVAPSVYDTRAQDRDLAAKSPEGRFVYARDEKSQLRRNMAKVESEGLIDEVAKLLIANEEDSRVAIGVVVTDESHGTHWTDKAGASGQFGTPASMRASGRVKARQKAIDRIQAELAARDEKNVNARIWERMTGEAEFMSFEQAAYHGSPHVFDKFSLEKIGTGEGAQAYGWGMYFAGRKDVANYYRHELVGDPVPIFAALTPEENKELVPWIRRKIATPQPGWPPHALAKEVLRDFQHRLEDEQRRLAEPEPMQPWLTEERIANIQKTVGVLEKLVAANDFAHTASMKGRTYKVDIPEDDTFLDWDKPLSEQPEKVKAALHREWLAHPTAHANQAGARIYGEMVSAEANRLADEESTTAVHRFANVGAEAASRKLAALGISGIKYLDQMSRDAGKGSHNYVVFDEDVIKILDFEQAQRSGWVSVEGGGELGKGPRGMIRIRQQGISIELYAHADLSTFLHETGHFYLTVLTHLAQKPDAPSDIVSDLATVRAWLGAEEGAELTRKQHEQFARGFEAYLMEGKAPSSALREAFSRFRAWLVFVYRSLKNLDVELSPEVRAVFDRMLATEDEIQAAEAEQKIAPLFPRETGMSKAQFATYQSAREEARRSAEESLTQKVMKDYLRESTQVWKDERARVRVQVAAEVNQEPASLARAVLTRKKLPDGSELPEGLEPVKLSKQALVEEYAPRPEYFDLLDRLPRPYVYAKEGGIHPDDAAALFGFGSGDELIQSLLSGLDPRQRIEQLTDQRMGERHSDELLTPAELPIEAMKAVHNEKRSELLQLELEHLVSENFATFKGLVKRVARRVTPLPAVRAEAERIVQAKKVRDVQPIVYQRAESKAGKAAVDAMGKGDWELAFEEKQRELLNHELYRAATDAQTRLKVIVDYMARFDKPRVRARLGKAGGDYLEQIDAIRERHDFAKGVSLVALDKRQSLLAFVQEHEKLGLSINVPQELLVEARRKHYKDMTFAELTGLYDTVKQIDHLARFKNQLLASNRARELGEARTDIVSSIEAHHDLTPEPEEHIRGLKYKIGSLGRGALAEHTRMEFLFEALDGYIPLGPVWQYFFKPFALAENAENEMQKKDAEALRTIFGAYTRRERARWFTDRIHVPEARSAKSDGNFTKEHIFMMALNWGNEYNRDALLQGWGWTEPQVMHVLDRYMSEQDWKTVQAIWDYIDTYWPAAEALEKKVTGLAPEKVEATPIVTKYGELRGGYFPIVFDRDVSTRQAALEEASDVSDMFGGISARAMTRHNHLIARQNTGGKPLLLEMSVISQHLSQVVHDLAYRPAVIDVARLIRDDGIREAIERAVGREMYRQLGPWLKAVAGDRPREYSGFIASVAGHARAGATVVSLGIKVTSSVMQLLGYGLTVKELGTKHALAGLDQAFRNPFRARRQWEFITERSAMMRHRMANYDRDVRDYSRKLSLIPIESSSWFIFIGYMDRAASMASWLGAYSKAMDGHLANVEKGDEASAIDFADAIVRTTQSAGAAKDLASIQRGGELQRLFTMFYSSLGLLFNQFAKSTGQYIQDKSKARLFAAFMYLWFVPAIMEEVIRGNLPDEDDDEGWLAWLIRTELSYPFATVVLLRDIASALERKLLTGRKDFSGSPALEAGDAIVGALGAAAKVATGDDVTRGDMKDVVLATGYVAKLPSRQLWQTGEYFTDWWAGEQQPSWVGEGLYRGIVIGKPRR